MDKRLYESGLWVVGWPAGTCADMRMHTSPQTPTHMTHCAYTWVHSGQCHGFVRLLWWEWGGKLRKSSRAIHVVQQIAMALNVTTGSIQRPNHAGSLLDAAQSCAVCIICVHCRILCDQAPSPRLVSTKNRKKEALYFRRSPLHCCTAS